VNSKFIPEMLNSLFQSTDVTPENVISKIDSVETCTSDQKVTTWLHRYIPSLKLNKSALSKFIRFVTGAESILPSMTIKLEFTNQQHIRPLLKTCFKILILARQYRSFFLFKGIHP